MATSSPGGGRKAGGGEVGVSVLGRLGVVLVARPYSFQISQKRCCSPSLLQKTRTE